MTGIAKNTVAKLLCGIGKACEEYHDSIMVNLPCKRLQVDEISAFGYAKQKNVPAEYQGQFGYGGGCGRSSVEHRGLGGAAG